VFGCNMPITSVNLSLPAYQIFDIWKKKRLGSDHLSAAVLLYEYTRSQNDASDMLWTHANLLLIPGDTRVSVTGDVLTWSKDGWVVKGG